MGVILPPQMTVMGALWPLHYFFFLPEADVSLHVLRGHIPACKAPTVHLAMKHAWIAVTGVIQPVLTDAIQDTINSPLLLPTAVFLPVLPPIIPTMKPILVSHVMKLAETVLVQQVLNAQNVIQDCILQLHQPVSPQQVVHKELIQIRRLPPARVNFNKIVFRDLIQMK